MKPINHCLSTALLLAAMLSLPVNAATPGYTQLIVLIKRDVLPDPTHKRAPDPLQDLKQLAPGLAPLVPASATRTQESLQALQRHRLDRYYLVDTRDKTRAQAEALAAQLRRSPVVESAQFEPIVDGMERDNGALIAHTGDTNIPDYTPRQHYLQGQRAVAPYKIGGVNAVHAWDVDGGKGDRMRVISAEIGHWSYRHVDLLAPFMELIEPDDPAETDSHDTASAGVIASRDNGFGTTGIVPLTQLGYMKWGTERLARIAERLEAGDVMQLGVHYLYADNHFPKDLCTSDCYMPLEASDVVRDTIAYLTEEKGVHVVLAAANGNINLDHPYFEGYYDRDRFDSGAIYAGAVDPETGLRASFSQYGKRVDLFSWGDHVTTTTWSRNNPTRGYTHTFSGTSSSNPILAGVVASLQGVARAKGLGNLPPKALRQILVATGYPQIDGNRTQIGVQPDLAGAIDKMLADHGDLPPNGRLAAPEEALSAQTFTVRVHAESPSNKPLTYRWDTAGFTPSTGTSTTLTLTAPTVPADTVMPVSVDVSDGAKTIKLTEHILVKAAPQTGCGDTPPWDAGKSYATYAEAVAYLGKVYKQNYYNINMPPDRHSGPHSEPWLTGVACPSP